MSIESKTKEQILEPYYKQNNGGLDEWIDYEDALLAMEQYARSRAIEFQDLIDDSTYTKDTKTGLWYCVKGVPVGDKKYFTTKELYEKLFSQQTENHSIDK